jgi:hypothetical protein
MNIEFIGTARPDQNGGMGIRVKIDDRIVICHFTQEALQDVNPATRMLSPIEQYEANETKLKVVAEQLIRGGKIQNGQVFVGTNDVRP